MRQWSLLRGARRFVHSSTAQPARLSYKVVAPVETLETDCFGEINGIEIEELDRLLLTGEYEAPDPRDGPPELKEMLPPSDARCVCFTNREQIVKIRNKLGITASQMRGVLEAFLEAGVKI